jgi:hypothetical protein
VLQVPLLKKSQPSNQNYLFKTDELISVQQILTKFSIIFISKTKRLLLETFFVYEFYSSSPITGFLLAGYIGTTLYFSKWPLSKLEVIFDKFLNTADNDFVTKYKTTTKIRSLCLGLVLVLHEQKSVLLGSMRYLEYPQRESNVRS